MKFVSWNVNGLRACVQKGFLDFFNSVNADFFCLQETKLQEGQISLDLPGYEQYWCYAEKKGYSGTAIFTRHTPQSVHYGIGIPELDTEGRVITLEYPEFYLVTCYTPNAQRGLARLDHRLKWESAFRAYLKALDREKPVILCGDLNVAHKEIDLKNPASNRGSAGFSDEERQAFTDLLDSGFTDSFRHLNPTATGCYTWWSYMFNARLNNAGWRIDYFVVSDRLNDAIVRTPIHADILGSDHCPVELELDIPCNGSIWQETAVGTASATVPTDTSKIKPSGSTAIRAGICALLLVIGFAAGYFVRDLFFDNRTIWEDMTTAQLVAEAMRIPNLSTEFTVASSTIVQDSIYENLKKEYPVLAELETREDALNELLSVMVSSYYSPGTYRENARILYGCIEYRQQQAGIAALPIGA